MAWDAGTITNAAPWDALAQKLEDLCGDTGVVNWSYVERIPAGTGTNQSGSSTYAVDVFKCAGTGTDANDSGTDWYFALEIPVTDGAVSSGWGVFEDYGGTKQFRRPAATSTTTAPTGSGFWRTDTLASYAAVTGKLTGSGPTLNTTGFSYWVKLTRNAVHLATRVGSTSANWGAHLMDSLISAYTDGCPLVALNSIGNTANFTRLPGVTDATLSKWATETMDAWTPGEGSNAVNENDFWQGGKGVASRIACHHENTHADMRLKGGMRGLIKADFLRIRAGGTVELGDTTTIDGNTWTVIAKDNFGQMTASHVITRPV